MSVKECLGSDCGIHVPGSAAGRGADLFVGSAQGRAGSASRRRAERSQDHSGEARRCGRWRRTRSPRSTRSRPAPAAPSKRSAGYAVFSTFGVKLFFAGGTTGKGMVVNHRTGRQTFMKMLQVQGGLGFGVNQNRLIFVFANEQALQELHQPGLGVRRPGQPVGHGGWPGRHVQRRGRRVARRVPLPADADRPCGHAYGRRHEVLQGRRSELMRSLR